MNWYLIGAIVVAFALPILLKRIGMTSEASARSLLGQGAKLVDVRTPAEFQSGHLPGAINLPVTQIREMAPATLPDRETILLVHCHSGSRSQIAKRLLRRMGYTQVHNLGSYGRTERIVKRSA